MNEAAIDSAGTTPLDPLLAEITAIGDQRAVVREIARLQALGVNDGPAFGAIADAKDSTATIAVLRTGGLGMPDASYYLRDDEHAKGIRTGYRAYIATQLQNLGGQATVAAAEADDIVALETALAKVTPNRAGVVRPGQKPIIRRPLRVYIRALAPQVPWDAFFAPFSGAAVPNGLTSFRRDWSHRSVIRSVVRRCPPGAHICASTSSTPTHRHCPSASPTLRSRFTTECCRA